MPAATIAIVGSLNVDLVTRTPRVPAGGETLTASSFDIGFGGKGANQAVACARLSRPSNHASAGASNSSDAVEVRMIGALGEEQGDPFARDYVTSLERDGLNVDGIRRVAGSKTGVATILVEETTGENRILLAPNANYSFRDDEVLMDKHADVVLFQLEIPLKTVITNIADAKRRGMSVILNPAPAVLLPAEVFRGLDHLILNETEAAILSGRRAEEISADSLDDLTSVAVDFVQKGVQNVVITLGSHGVFYYTSTQKQKQGSFIPARRVKVVDTTAAGDTFVGAYAVAIARAFSKEPAAASAASAQFDIAKAIQTANYAASLTVQRKGAQSAIPWLDELKEE